MALDIKDVRSTSTSPLRVGLCRPRNNNNQAMTPERKKAYCIISRMRESESCMVIPESFEPYISVFSLIGRMDIAISRKPLPNVVSGCSVKQSENTCNQPAPSEASRGRASRS